MSIVYANARKRFLHCIATQLTDDSFLFRNTSISLKSFKAAPTSSGDGVEGDADRAAVSPFEDHFLFHYTRGRNPGEPEICQLEIYSRTNERERLCKTHSIILWQECKHSISFSRCGCDRPTESLVRGRTSILVNFADEQVQLRFYVLRCEDKEEPMVFLLVNGVCTRRDLPVLPEVLAPADAITRLESIHNWKHATKCSVFPLLLSSQSRMATIAVY